jgi:cold shock CspA family protein
LTVAGPIPSAGPHHGRVTSFDHTRGLGRVAESDDTDYPFHATAIADGSRDIEVDTAVVFTVAPGHRGHFEARALSPAAAAQPAEKPPSAPAPA